MLLAAQVCVLQLQPVCRASWPAAHASLHPHHHQPHHHLPAAALLLLLPYCRATARACQLTRGLLPMLATPGPNGDAVLEAAVVAAARAGLVAPRHHVVVLQQIHDDFCVKVGAILDGVMHCDVTLCCMGRAAAES
jgi:hypothetical protein